MAPILFLYTGRRIYLQILKTSLQIFAYKLQNVGSILDPLSTYRGGGLHEVGCDYGFDIIFRYMLPNCKKKSKFFFLWVIGNQYAFFQNQKLTSDNFSGI